MGMLPVWLLVVYFIKIPLIIRNYSPMTNPVIREFLGVNKYFSHDKYHLSLNGPIYKKSKKKMGEIISEFR